MWQCSLIVRISVVLRRTVVGNGDGRFSNESGSYHQSQVNEHSGLVICSRSGNRSWLVCFDPLVKLYHSVRSDCDASYIGEIGRNLTTRMTEHKRTTRKDDAKDHISEHHRLTNRTIDWDSAQCLPYSINHIQLLTLETWFIDLEQAPLKRCQQLPSPYKRHIHDIDIIDIIDEPNRTT